MNCIGVKEKIIRGNIACLYTYIILLVLLHMVWF